VHWLDPVSLVLLVIAVAIFGAVLATLLGFIQSSSRDPLTPQAPDPRSAQARRMAGVYVRRPQPSGEPRPAPLDRERQTV
jgi:hypothetical protein